MVNKVSDAHKPLDEAEDQKIDIFQTDIDFVRYEINLLRGVASAQFNTIRISGRIDKLLDRLEAEDRINARTHRRRYLELSDKFRDQLREIEQLLANLNSYDGSLSPQADYGSKVDQLTDEVEFYADINPFFDRVLEGLDRLETARDEFRASNYNTAKIVAQSAEDHFSDIRSDVRGLESKSLEPTIDLFVATSDELIATASEIRRDAAEAESR